VEPTTSAAADYAGRILAAVLEEIQRIVDLDRRRLRFPSFFSMLQLDKMSALTGHRGSQQ
jgi:hypothetical protein